MHACKIYTLAKWTLYDVGKCQDMDEDCHEGGDKDEGVALDEQVQTKLPNSTSQLLHKSLPNSMTLPTSRPI